MTLGQIEHDEPMPIVVGTLKSRTQFIHRHNLAVIAVQTVAHQLGDEHHSTAPGATAETDLLVIGDPE